MIPNGIVLWDGPSLLNRRRIVAIATNLLTPSRNRKTGPVVQTWILNAQDPPHVASSQGTDDSVCGYCPLRRYLDGGCYVIPGQAPRAVWDTWTRGGYAKLSLRASAQILRQRRIRIAAYGDPAAVPMHVWSAIAPDARKRTAYTHMWEIAPQLRGFACASVDSIAERNAAQRKGWQTFLVSRDSDKLSARCPSHTGTQCCDCNLCNGARRTSIRIHPHGALSTRF